MKGKYAMHTQEYRVKRVGDVGAMVFADVGDGYDIIHISHDTWMEMGEPVLIRVAMVGLEYRVTAVPCDECGGNGSIGMKSSEYRTCKKCAGKGKVKV